MIYFIQIDRLYEWKANRHKDVQDVIASQAPNTKMEFDKRSQEVRFQCFVVVLTNSSCSSL